MHVKIVTILSEGLKQILKPVFEGIIDKVEDTADKIDLEKEVVKKLDQNGDGILNKQDMADLMLDFIDANGDGKVSIWEYIAFFFNLWRILKEIKK